MAVYVKNNSGVANVYRGMSFAIDEYKLLSGLVKTLWSNDSFILEEIASANLTMARSDDGSADISDVNEAIEFLKSNEVKNTNAKTYPFASKVLEDGKKLYKRVHGKTISINNETKDIELVIPYDNCKITGVEFIGASIGDKANLKVLDTPTGTLSTIPNYMLNQFGFDVYLSKDYHKETSQYDADLIKDMKLLIEYTTTDTTKSIYANFILHEVKS